MRLRLVFALENKGAWVPFHHQNLLFQFIREQLEADEEQYAQFQFYNFSGLKGQTKISRQGLHFFSSKVTLVLSSPNQAYLDYLLAQVFAKEEVRIGTLQLKPLTSEVEEEPEWHDSTKYVCISPIVLINPIQDSYYAKKFISPEDDVFSDLLYESTMARMEQSGRFSSQEIASFYKFQVVPDRIYLKKIQESEKKFARIYTFQEGKRKLEARGYTLPFTLYALPEVQRFVFECGLGAYTHRGFGMIDVANADSMKRIQPYQAKP
ncbi:MAG: hypothetical protein OHK0053_22260 [Microscillaceae bacterium]